MARVKGECNPGTYHWDAWLVIFELTLLISAWRWSKARGATWILVALKTRLLEKLVPIRSDESECVMTEVSRSCFALAPLFQKSAPAKSESRKKSFFFVSPFVFYHLLLFFIKTPKRHF